MTQGNYTAGSWSAFQTALQQARSILVADSPTQDEICSAINNLTAAKNALTEKSNHSGSDSGESKRKKTPAGTETEQNSDFKSDTTETYRFG